MHARQTGAGAVMDHSAAASGRRLPNAILPVAAAAGALFLVLVGLCYRCHPVVHSFTLEPPIPREIGISLPHFDSATVQPVFLKLHDDSHFVYLEVRFTSAPGRQRRVKASLVVFDANGETVCSDVRQICDPVGVFYESGMVYADGTIQLGSFRVPAAEVRTQGAMFPMSRRAFDAAYRIEGTITEPPF
jgi:hypothetical protein